MLLQGGRQPPAPRAPAPGRPPRDPRARAARQDHRRRPVADRAHAALEPGDLHRPVRRHPRPLLARPRRRGRAATSRGASRFNVKGGRCEVCRGDGQIKIEMHFLPDVYVPCEQCHGKRYNRETLEVRFKGKNIADVLDMPVEEAVDVLRAHPEDPPPPGDAERRRARLHPPRPAGDDALGRRGAARQARDRAVEGRDRRAPSTSSTSRPPACTSPTCSACSRCSQRLVDAGNTVVVIEHNLDVIKTRRPADRPGPRGRRGGRPGGRRRHARGGRGRAPARTPGGSSRSCSTPASRPARRQRRQRPRAAQTAPEGRRVSDQAAGARRAVGARALATRRACGRRSGAGMSGTRCRGTARGSTGSSCAARRSCAGRCTATCSRRCARGAWRSARTCCSSRACGSPRRARARGGSAPGTFLNLGVMVAAQRAGGDRRALHACQRLLRLRRQPPLRRPGASPITWQGFESEGPTRIGDNCWLGANVVVTSGVTIGERCVIGANSVVTRTSSRSRSRLGRRRR